MAVLLDSTGRRGEHGGHGYGERRRRTRSVVLRERAEEGEGVQSERGETQGVEGVSMARSEEPGRRSGSRSWPGRRRRAPASCFVRWRGEEDARAPGGLAGPAGPACGRQVRKLSLSFY